MTSVPGEAAAPVDFLFHGMEKLGPGGNAETLHVLRLLPERRFRVVVDAGCGTGRQTLVLAKQLQTPINAIDSSERFLTELSQRARAANLEQFVATRCMDMKDIPDVFPNVELLWSEGAAYNIGFRNALVTWARAITPGGFAVVSELSWLKTHPPAPVRDFFASAYADMRSVEQNVAAAETAGYKVLTTYTLPPQTWTDGYYDLLGPRAQALLSHSDSAVRDFAAETLREIEAFQSSEGSYGYVFYLLQRVRRLTLGFFWL
ncbi:MAG: class I SAM-dependent methyltransferase [Verrucomicrobiaceae bacterium]|nr:class I SAM-dependent methyltransferase [Verrucomicrobiaceae bacterium]